MRRIPYQLVLLNKYIICQTTKKCHHCMRCTCAIRMAESRKMLILFPVYFQKYYCTCNRVVLCWIIIQFCQFTSQLIISENISLTCKLFFYFFLILRKSNMMLKFILNQSTKLRFVYVKNSKQDIQKENRKILGYFIKFRKKFNSFCNNYRCSELLNVTENKQ